MLNILQDNPPARRGRRGFFAPTEQEKVQIRLDKLSKKITKKEKTLERYGNLSKKIGVEKDRLQVKVEGCKSQP